MTAATGIISSPGYPAKYVKDLDCTTRISVESGKKLLLNFTTFELESGSSNICTYDYLQITDGNVSSKFCGKKTDTFFLSKTNKLNLRFKTDYARNHVGYYATYTTVNGKFLCLYYFRVLLSLVLIEMVIFQFNCSNIPVPEVMLCKLSN